MTLNLYYLIFNLTAYLIYKIKTCLPFLYSLFTMLYTQIIKFTNNKKLFVVKIDIFSEIFGSQYYVDNQLDRKMVKDLFPKKSVSRQSIIVN